MATTTQLGTYSPEDVLILIQNDNFSHEINGLADGTFVTIGRDVPRATLYTGADKSAARVLRSVRTGSITLTLHQSSESNDVLSALAEADEQARDSTWLFSVTVKDLTGRSVFFAPQAFLGTDPDTTYGTDIETREWTITYMNGTRVLGGNSKFNPDTETTLATLGVTNDPKWSMGQN